MINKFYIFIYINLLKIIHNFDLKNIKQKTMQFEIL